MNRGGCGGGPGRGGRGFGGRGGGPGFGPGGPGFGPGGPGFGPGGPGFGPGGPGFGGRGPRGPGFGPRGPGPWSGPRGPRPGGGGGPGPGPWSGPRGPRPGGGGGPGSGCGSGTGGGNQGQGGMWRDERPSNKILTITSFSVIKGRGEPYESSVFEAGGYKWRLVLYVNGNQNDGGNNHISLYVRIEETESLPKGWEVNVELKLFVYNGKQRKYLIVKDGIVKRYNDAKKEWGYGKLIPLTTFLDTNEGYLEQDIASFGAEIFSGTAVQVQEKVTFISNPPNNVFTWKILHFSNLEDKFYYSDDFLVEDRYWRLGFNPKGTGDGRSQAIPIFLYAQGHKPNAVATNTWGAVNLRLKNQRSSNHAQIYSAAWYPTRSDYGVGVNTIISLAEFNSITTITTARPCKTFLISSYSLSITPENPNLESDFTSTRFVTVFTIRRLNPHHVVPFFVNRRHEKPQIQSDRSLPLISDNINSFRDRTRDILSVVVALLFGVGCGALTAATMYLVWALVVNRQSYDFEEEEDDYENDESDAASLKKLGYVKIPAPAPAPVKEAA